MLKFLKAYIKMEKTTIKFGNIEIKKKKITNIKDLSQQKIQILIRHPLVKTILNISLVVKILKLDLYVYFSQKCVRIEETLMKLNICLF